VGIVIHKPTDPTPTIEFGFPTSAVTAYIPFIGETWSTYQDFDFTFITNNTLPV
jgi:hypothetical protein